MIKEMADAIEEYSDYPVEVIHDFTPPGGSETCSAIVAEKANLCIFSAIANIARTVEDTDNVPVLQFALEDIFELAQAAQTFNKAHQNRGGMKEVLY